MRIRTQSEVWGVPLVKVWSEYDNDYIAKADMSWAPDLDEDKNETYFIGGRGSPAVLYAQHSMGTLTLAQLRRRLGIAWYTCGRPFLELSKEHWTEMFHTAGPTLNGWPISGTEFPPVTLYRTAEESYREGWAWGDNVDVVASIRAHRSKVGPLSPIYRVEAPPSSIRCVIVYPKNWTEFVIDTAGLVIRDISKQVDAQLRGAAA